MIRRLLPVSAILWAACLGAAGPLLPAQAEERDTTPETREFRRIAREMVALWAEHPEEFPGMYDSEYIVKYELDEWDLKRLKDFGSAVESMNLVPQERVFLTVKEGGREVEREVDARNYGKSLPLTIELSLTRWRKMKDPVLKKALVYHEVLGLLGEDYVTYDLSKPYLAHLRRTEAAALAGTGPDRTIRMAIGYDHACALSSTKQVRCWGSNFRGQVGMPSVRGGEMNVSFPPTPINSIPGKRVRYLVAGDHHSCVLLNDGRVMCWGSNVEGAVGGDLPYSPGESGDRPGRFEKPTFAYGDPYAGSGVPGFDPAVLLAAGPDVTGILTQNGDFFYWGYGFLECPTGCRVGRPRRLFTLSLQDVRQVSQLKLGISHGCLLWRSGEVSCFGHVDGSALPASSEPEKIPGINDAVQLVVGNFFSCALRRNGQVVCWGGNTEGALGDGSDEPGRAERGDWKKPSAVLLKAGSVFAADIPLRQVRAIAAGRSHVCARRSDGSVYCWGSNRAGQLVRPRGEEWSTLALPVEGLGDKVSMIFGGAFSSCAVLANGSVLCWGHPPEGLEWDLTRPYPIHGL